MKNRRPQIAAITTVYHRHSHAQHIVDRFLEGYGWEGRHHRPAMDLVSLYVEQVGETDLSRDRAKRHPTMKIYPTIAEALTRGGKKLAVDGVLLIGEHGKYKRNWKGQRLYPRYEYFKQIVDVFQAGVRSVPVFNDKHLSWKWEQARWMYGTARRMGFALMAGSSLPVVPRIPSIDMPRGAAVREAMCVSYGKVDSYDFHALEVLQCMVERRRGGECGVRWLEAFEGERFWQAHKRGQWSPRLFEAALARCDRLNLEKPGYNAILPSTEQVRAAVKNPIAYQYEHHDGLKCTMILLNGLMSSWAFAAKLADRDEPVSTLMNTQMPTKNSSLATFFSPLVHHIESLVQTGRSPYPVERTLLTTGLVAAGVESLHKGQQRIATPHLAIAYAAPRQSTFAAT